MQHHIVFEVAGIGILSQDMSFPDDPASIASPLGAGRYGAARLKGGRGRQRRIVLGTGGIGIFSRERGRAVCRWCSWERGRPARSGPQMTRRRHVDALARTWERGRPARIDCGGPSARLRAGRPRSQEAAFHLRAGRPHPGGMCRSQDMSFPDDSASIASPLGPGATAWRG